MSARSTITSWGAPIGMCPRCWGDVVWAISAASGKLTLVNPEPAKDGNVLLAARGGNVWATVLSKTAALSAPGALHTLHSATCPNAANRKGQAR